MIPQNYLGIYYQPLVLGCLVFQVQGRGALVTPRRRLSLACSHFGLAGPLFRAPAMDGAGAMTAEALRAEIAATRRRQQAAEGRGQELDAELRQAVERQMLRQELEAARSELAEQEAANRIKAELKQDVDMDRNSLALEPFRSRSASQTSGGRLYATGGESKSFGNRVARGEFVSTRFLQ